MSNLRRLAISALAVLALPTLAAPAASATPARAVSNAASLFTWGVGSALCPAGTPRAGQMPLPYTLPQWRCGAITL